MQRDFKVVFMVILGLVACSSGNGSKDDGGSDDNGSGPGCEGGRKEFQSCDDPAQCCSGICGGDCRCSREGGACDTEEDCCGGSCENGVCLSSALGETCDSDLDCTSHVCEPIEGQLLDGICACGKCVEDADCCDGKICQLGACAVAQGDTCFADRECQSHDCAGGVCACSALENDTEVSFTPQCRESSDCCGDVPCTGHTCCKPGGATCTTRDECCSNECLNGQCRDSGFRDGCNQDDDCRTGKCSWYGECEMGLAGDSCEQSSDCTGQCISGVCSCAGPSNLCEVDADCCGGTCEWKRGLQWCVGGTTCVPLFDTCQTGDDCCGGLTCAGPGTACCATAGTGCTENYECCSGSCDAGFCE